MWWRHDASEAEPVQPNKLFIDLDTTTVIYKIHGTIDRRDNELGGYVITEEDYEETTPAEVPAARGGAGELRGARVV